MFRFLRQLFASRGARQSDWQPAAEPTPAQAARHAAWLDARVYRNWLSPYYKAYHWRKAGIANRHGLRVELIREEGRQGALFFYDPSIGSGNFEHLFWLLSERIVLLGYYRACHDRRQRKRQRMRESVVKQLFKPNPTACAHSGRCNQRFGLIHLDLVCVNNQPLFIRLITNPLRTEEENITPPQSFDRLLQEVFDEPAAGDTERARVREFAS